MKSCKSQNQNVEMDSQFNGEPLQLDQQHKLGINLSGFTKRGIMTKKLSLTRLATYSGYAAWGLKEIYKGIYSKCPQNVLKREQI